MGTIVKIVLSLNFFSTDLFEAIRCSLLINNLGDFSVIPTPRRLGVMLERATACFESAGRRLFRDSNDAIRTRRSLCRDFWKHSATTEDFSNWFLAFVQPSSQRPSSALNLASRNQNPSAPDGGIPFLEFLYPEITSSPALRISRHSRRLGLRRRRRTLVGFPRTYASEAVPNTNAALPDSSSIHRQASQVESDDPVAQAMIDLSRMLGKKQKDFDKAWVLYLAAGRPSISRSGLCEYLASSGKSSDWDRAWQVFEEIPPEDRTPDDFYHVTQSQIQQENSSRLSEIARLVTTHEISKACIPWIFAHFWTSQLWASAVEAWEIGSHQQLADNTRSNVIFSCVKDDSFLVNGIEFGNYLSDHPAEQNRSSLDLGLMFLETISRSPTHPENAPLDALLEILRVYHNLGLSRIRHYRSIIHTLQSSKSRSVSSRAIVFYRRLRSQYPDFRPPYALLERQLVTMKSRNISSGITFFLDELARFHPPPGKKAYLAALNCLAHAGDVSQVESIFDRMLGDHGNPSDCAAALPLLVVYAENGNVKETYRQFQRLSDEFNLEPNIFCWNVLLKAHAKNNDWASARETYSRMLTAGVRPDSYTFGTLMGISADRGDIEGSRQLLREARQHHVSITMPMLDTIISVYCKNGQLKLAEQLAEACVKIPIEGSYTRMWNAILYQYARRLDVKSCYRIKRRMEAANIKPDSWTYSATMLGLVLIGRPNRARDYLRKLHQHRSMYADEYHYTLVLFGYVEKRNRDMVHIVFKEIVERFGKAGPFSSFLYLRSQAERDLEIAKEAGITSGDELNLKHAEKALAQYIANSHASNPSYKFSRTPADDASVTRQYEYLIKQYGTRGAIRHARALYQQFLDNRVPVDTKGNNVGMVPYQVLTSMMAAHLNVAEYKEAEELWKLALADAIQKASRLDFEISSVPFSDSEPQGAAKPTDRLPRRNSTGPQTSTSSSVNASVPQNESSKILPTQRFILAKPLSLYMRVLGYQNRTSKINHVVADLEKLGFALTTFNWSTWVQMLASSDSYNDQVKAFRMFEEKFAPHFPGWYKLLRGFGRKSSEMTNTTWMLEDPRTESFRDVSGKSTRKYWINIEPDLLQPTYLTMSFLAASLDRVRDKTITQGNLELQKINTIAPKTVQMIGEMPYQRDKLQGVMIRHRSQQADKAPSPSEPYIIRGGVLSRAGKPTPRPDIFVDDETLETHQPDFPHHIFESKNQFSSIEGSAEPSLSDEAQFDPPFNPMSPADQIDTEGHFRHSRANQRRQRNLRFSRVIEREKKRREGPKRQRKLANGQSLTENEPSGDETQVFDENRDEDFATWSQHQKNSMVEVSVDKEEFQSQTEKVKQTTENPSEILDESKARK